MIKMICIGNLLRSQHYRNERGNDILINLKIQLEELTSSCVTTLVNMISYYFGVGRHTFLVFVPDDVSMLIPPGTD